MFDFSPIEIIIVLVIALLVFGPKRLPEMGRSIGRGIREFKGAVLDEDDGSRERREEPARSPRRRRRPRRPATRTTRSSRAWSCRGTPRRARPRPDPEARWPASAG